MSFKFPRGRPKFETTAPTFIRMLLHLSRASFWLAAIAASWALIGPASLETALTVVAGVALLLAFVLWRSAMSANRRSYAGDAAVPQTAVLTSDSLVDAAAAVVRVADEAASFDAAVQAAAGVLKSELGAHAVQLHVGAGVTPAADDAAVIELPARISFVVGGNEAPACGVELLDIEMSVDADALRSLLDLTRTSLRSAERRMACPSTVLLPTRSRPPAGRDADGPDARNAPATGSEAAKEPRNSGSHVLVVEDNVVQTETTARMLRRLGCRVTMASGMLEGLHALCATNFDLVLMDTQMPGVSASEALNWLRDRSQGAVQHDSAGSTPVVAMCWNGSEGDAERFRALGFDDCLFKPLRLRQVRSMLSAHVRMRAPEPEAGGAVGAPPSADVLDPAALARLRELDPKGENQLVERVLKAFQTSAARLGPQLQTARESQDRATVRLVAHTLKSSSASIGAMTLSQQCADLEALIRNESGDDIEPSIAAVSESLAATLRAIQRVLDTQR